MTIKHYAMVVRHEPDTHKESESGWWYSHYRFQEESDASAIERGHAITREVGDECEKTSMQNLGHRCNDSLDELYRVDDEALIWIYDDDVYQSISWDKDGRRIKVKRVTDDAIHALLTIRSTAEYLVT